MPKRNANIVVTLVSIAESLQKNTPIFAINALINLKGKSTILGAKNAVSDLFPVSLFVSSATIVGRKNAGLAEKRSKVLAGFIVLMCAIKSNTRLGLSRVGIVEKTLLLGISTKDIVRESARARHPESQQAKREADTNTRNGLKMFTEEIIILAKNAGQATKYTPTT